MLNASTSGSGDQSSSHAPPTPDLPVHDDFDAWPQAVTLQNGSVQHPDTPKNIASPLDMTPVTLPTSDTHSVSPHITAPADSLVDMTSVSDPHPVSQSFAPAASSFGGMSFALMAQVRHSDVNHSMATSSSSDHTATFFLPLTANSQTNVQTFRQLLDAPLDQSMRQPLGSSTNDLTLNQSLNGNLGRLGIDQSTNQSNNHTVDARLTVDPAQIQSKSTSWSRQTSENSTTDSTLCQTIHDDRSISQSDNHVTSDARLTVTPAQLPSKPVSFKPTHLGGKYDVQKKRTTAKPNSDNVNTTDSQTQMNIRDKFDQFKKQMREEMAEALNQRPPTNASDADEDHEKTRQRTFAAREWHFAQTIA